MKYMIQAGALYTMDKGQPREKLSFINSPFYPVRKTILSSDGCVKLYADIQSNQNGIGERCYVLKDPLDQVILMGIPGSSKIANPIRINQVKLTMDQNSYILTMKNSQECSLADQNNRKVIAIHHNGFEGGWLMEAQPEFSPYILMGFYIFFRYLDKENEFVTEWKGIPDE